MSDRNDVAVSEIAPPARSRSAFYGQVGRYLIVGGVAFIVDFSALCFLVEFAGFPPMVAAAVAFVCGLVSNYLMSIRWVFESRSVNQPLIEFLVFVVIGLFGLGWNELFLYLGAKQFGLNYKISKLASAIVVLCWNFGVRKILLFRDRG
jgi:putative flippase GtrA